jgi:hypothetical protein
LPCKSLPRKYRKAKHFERQGETALSPQPPKHDCLDAFVLWKSNEEEHAWLS